MSITTLNFISIDIPEINVVKVRDGIGKNVQYNKMGNRPTIFKHLRSKGVWSLIPGLNSIRIGYR
jgi:hypothetical protein